MDSAADTPKGVGCPIRKSPDQRLLPSPRSLSQGATSFIASRCQGIHQMPFSSLENLKTDPPCAGTSPNRIHESASCETSRMSASAKTTNGSRPRTDTNRRKPDEGFRNISNNRHHTTLTDQHQPGASTRIPQHGQTRRASVPTQSPETRTSSHCPRPARNPLAPRKNAKTTSAQNHARHARSERHTRQTRQAGPWWSRTESNRRPPACKAGALPTELRPRLGLP